MYTPQVNIDYSKCKECGICNQECPNHMKKIGHVHVDHNYEYCDKCLHCYAVCPENAITVKEVNVKPTEREIKASGLMSLFMHRRSYRRFIDKPLTDNEIIELCQSTTYIPSGGNDHRINITVLKTEQKRIELHSEIVRYYSHIKNLMMNPLLKFIARYSGDEKVKATIRDPFYFNKILKHIQGIGNSDDPVFYHAPAVFIFHTDRIMPTAKEDCVLCAYNLVLMSEALGLGSCFVSLAQQAITNSKRCKEILEIPYSHHIESVVIAGHPKRIYKRPAWRKPKDVNFI